jgi:branched-chain amino acid aminotransferase
VVSVSIDGVAVAPEAATISIFDRGLLFGDGLFETLRTLAGAPVELAAHLDRLYAGARELALHAPPRDDLTRWLRAAIADSADHRIRIVLTRGPGPLAMRFAELGAGRTIIIVEPLGAQPNELSLAIVDWPVARRAGPARKTLSFVDHLIARELAAAAGADEALRLDADGRVAECATANIFAVIAGAVVTPPATGILAGITRARVLALSSGSERALTVPELRVADEIFVTSSLRGVVPVTRLDGEVRSAGPITRSLVAAYFHAMRSLI